MSRKPATLEEARRLLARLERMSVDSSWARRASGLRGGLIKLIAELETGNTLSAADQMRLETTVDYAYLVLTRAARELRGTNFPDSAWTNRPLERSYWVLPGNILAGVYPGDFNPAEAQRKITWLLTAGFTYFLDLTESGELEPYDYLLQELDGCDHPIQHIRQPIRDASIPSTEDMGQILDLLDRALALGDQVYVHCWGGRGRTGTVIGCWLVRHGLSGEDALARIMHLRRVLPDYERQQPSPETDEQVEMVRNWRG